MRPTEILNFYTKIAQNDTEMFHTEGSREKIQEILYNVSKNGTSKKLLSDTKISIASKTATTLILSKNGYNSKQYYSAIVGFAPIDNPKYSCIVIVKCKPNAGEFYGATVAGPLFKKIVQSLF
jgi:cell division protein FtsI (penicillin-binding protein 3)